MNTAVSAHRKEAIERLARHLRAGRSVTLSTHINADGDGCGSEIALAYFLRQLGMSVTIVNPTPWPGMFQFLRDDEIPVLDPKGGGITALQSADLLIVVDISDVKRLGVLADTVRALKTTKLVIDHHLPSDEPPSSEMLSDTTACATGELVFDFGAQLGLALTPTIANALYVAIVTDTGGFRYSNTTPRCHAVAAELLAAGVDPEAMYQRIYASVPIGRLHVLRDALATLEVDPTYGLTWISVGPNALEEHAVRAEDLDGIAEHARSIAGTRMAIFFRDLGHNKVKISFRTTGHIDANAFAKQFGGGGHAKAAGAMVDGSLETVQHDVVAAARQYISAQARDER